MLFKKQYAINGSLIRSSRLCQVVSEKTTMAYAVLHSDTWFYENGRQWLYEINTYLKTHSSSLWNNPQWYSNSENGSTGKSLFDPCPVGWHLPQYNAFSNVVNLKAIGNWENGYYFALNGLSGTSEETYFPAAGYITTTNGSLNAVKESNITGSCQISTGRAYGFLFSHGSISLGSVGAMHYNSGSGGFTLRCIQE